MSNLVQQFTVKSGNATHDREMNAQLAKLSERGFTVANIDRTSVPIRGWRGASTHRVTSVITCTKKVQP